MPIPDVCPTCGKLYVVQCQCGVGERMCPDGHQWHLCPTHHIVVPTGYNHEGEICQCPEYLLARIGGEEPKEKEESPNKWPTIPGFYWYYGTLYKEDVPEIRTARVVKISNGYLHITEGVTIYEGEEARGIWQPLASPNCDELKELWRKRYGTGGN